MARKGGGGAPTLSIRLLGQVRFARGTMPWRLVAPPRTLPLLAYLLLKRDKELQRDAVAFALWPDDDESTARANLRRHLHYLHRALPPAAAAQPWLHVVGRTTLRWNVDAPCEIDVAAFEALSRNPQSRGRAVELYAGDLCEGMSDDWLLYERERLRDVQIANLNAGVAAFRRDGEAAAALRSLRRLLTLDPWREDAIRQAIELRYTLGDRAGAIAEYEGFAGRLHEEFAAEPMPETRAAFDAVLRNAPVTKAVLAQAVPANETRGAVLPFVGRDDDLATLRHWWNRATRGSGGVALLRGEGGIGKSRLLAELRTVAEGEGCRVLAGSAASNDALPYRPIVEALTGGAALLATPALETLRLSVAAEIVPELRVRRPDLPPAPSVEASRARPRLFEALLEIVTALAAQRPLLVILDDLHWADAATVDFLEFLASRIDTVRVLVVAAYRDGELMRGHPLRAAQRRLARSKRIAEHALGPIAADAVAQLVARLGKRARHLRDRAPELYARSEGHPLFLTQLIGAALEMPRDGATRSRLPEDLQRLVSERFGRLSEEGRGLALMGAVIGSSFDAELLRETTGWRDERIAAALGELLDRRLIRDGGPLVSGGYAFAHNLIEEAIYAEAASHELPQRHHRVAVVMEEIYADRLDEAALRIAGQFERSSAPARCAGYFARAARFASRLYAHDDALAHVARGLEHTTDAATRIDVLLARETANRGRGDAAARERDLAELGSLVSGPDRALTVELLRRRIDLAHVTDRRDEEATAIAEFVAIAEAGESEREKFEARWARARLAAVSSHYDDAIVAIHAALAAADAYGDRVARTQSYILMTDIYERVGDMAQAARAVDAARRFADELDDRTLQSNVLLMSCRVANWQDDYGAVETFATRLLELSRRCGDRNHEGTARNALGLCALYRFDVDDARRSFSSAAAIFEALMRPRNAVSARINVILLETRLGRCDEALAIARETRPIAAAAGATLYEEVIAKTTALALLRAGRIAEAWEAAREAAGLTRRSASRNRPAAEIALARCETAAGETAAAIARASAAVGELRAAARDVAAADGLGALAEAYLAARATEDALAAVDEMLPTLAADYRRFEEPDALYWTAARVLLASGNEARAAAALDAAWNVYQERAARVPDPEARASYAALPFHRELQETRDRLRTPATAV